MGLCLVTTDGLPVDTWRLLAADLVEVNRVDKSGYDLSVFDVWDSLDDSSSLELSRHKAVHPSQVYLNWVRLEQVSRMLAFTGSWCRDADRVLVVNDFLLSQIVRFGYHDRYTCAILDNLASLDEVIMLDFTNPRERSVFGNSADFSRVGLDVAQWDLLDYESIHLVNLHNCTGQTATEVRRMLADDNVLQGYVDLTLQSIGV